MSQTISQCMLALISLSLFHSQTAAQGDGSWSASALPPAVTAPAASGAGTDWTTAVTWPAGCESWANPCPAGAKTSGAAPSEAVVTWAAGCRSWANPCPASAVVSAAPATWSSASDYTNGFTSYTTMTNSNGIITGMPSKATIAAGVSSVLADQSSALAAQTTLSTVTSPAMSNTASPTYASASFVESASSTSATSQPYQGGAVAGRVVSNAAVLIVAGILILSFA